MKNVFFILLLLLAAMPHGFAEPSSAAEPTILSVEGQGEGAALPDTATISIGVMSADDNAAKAQNDNAALSQQVIAAMEEIGIAKGDLSTSNYSFYPTTSADDNGRNARTSYVVRNSITVTVHDLAATGRVIDAALASGANEIHSLDFLSHDTGKAREQALMRAVKDAREKAATIAKGVGMRVVGIKAISESTNAPEARPMMSLAMASKRADTPIEAGSLTITAAVHIDFILGS